MDERDRAPTGCFTAIMQVLGYLVLENGIALLDSERRSRDAWLAQHLAQLSPEERAAIRNVIPVFDKLADL